MKSLIFFFLCMASLAASAQTEVIDGELYIQESVGSNKAMNSITSHFNLKKVAIGREQEDGEIAILSDLIIHQDLKLYVINPNNGKVSRIDIDEKSDYYGSVDIVKGLIVKQDNNLYLVNPRNGKTKKIKEL